MKAQSMKTVNHSLPCTPQHVASSAIKVIATYIVICFLLHTTYTHWIATFRVLLLKAPSTQHRARQVVMHAWTGWKDGWVDEWPDK